MAGKEINRKLHHLPKITFICLIIAAAVFLIFRITTETAPTATVETQSEKSRIQVKNQPVIDFDKIDQDEILQEKMKKRKDRYGVHEGIDIVVNSDELFKIGGRTVSMGKIQNLIKLKQGGIIETEIESENSPQLPNIYGVYIVRPGDNIWNIHFKILASYFAHKDISLAPSSDEPDNRGFSSGVGKLLKFSEKMIYIYNLEEKRLENDLNMIIPFSKIVVYSMEQIFSLLDDIDYSQVNHLSFDGETLWIPANQ
jgi:hypothetical protein